MGLTKQQTDALTAFANAAVQSERLYDVPAQLTVAQAVLETGWGRKMPASNCFGIKTSASRPQCVVVTTHEVFTQEQYDAWKRTHVGFNSQIDERLADGKLRIRLDDTFAAFDSVDQCFEHHAVLLAERAPYKGMLDAYARHENLPLYVEQVAKRYATDPTYAKQCLAIMSMRPVQDALAAARKAKA